MKQSISACGIHQMHAILFRALLPVGVLCAGPALANKTNRWTNASGDGTWSNVENWSLGELPGDTDYVDILNTKDGEQLTIDVPDGVTVGAFIATNKRLRVTGEPLTLRGGVKGKVASWGDAGYCGTEDVWSFLTQVAVTMDCEVRFRPRCTTTIRAYYKGSTSAPLNFLKPVSYRQGHTGYNQFNLQTTHQSYSSISFHSSLDVGGTLVHAPEGNNNGWGKVHCHGKVTAKDINKNGWNGGLLFLYASDNEIPAMGNAYSGYFVPGGPGAFPTNAVLTIPGANGYVNTDVNESQGLILNNFNQTVDRLMSAYVGTWTGSTLKNQGNIYSYNLEHMKDISTGVYRAPTELTLRGTANGNALVSVNDRVSIVWNPTNDFRQVFSNCTGKTSGDIMVKRGEVSVRGTASFPNLHAIDVAAGATFDIDTSASGSFAALDRATVGANGTFRISDRAVTPFSGGYAVFQLADGATIDTAADVTIPVVEYAGAFVTNGTYSAADADWVTGAGHVTVDASDIAVWTNVAGGAWADAANWLGGRVPTATMKKVVLPCAAADYTVTLSGETALPKRVEVRNGGTGTATLKVTARVTHAGGILSVEPGGRLELATGGTYDYSGEGTSYSDKTSTPFRFVGGELLTSGGYMCISNATGGLVIGGKDGATGRIRQTSGRFLYHTTSAQNPIVLGEGGEIALSGDAWFRCGAVDGSSGYKTVPVFGNEGGTLTATDTARFDMSLSTFSWYVLHARGKRIFSGSSKYLQTVGDKGKFDFGTRGTNRAEIVFRDHATMNGTGSGTAAMNGILRYESDGLSASNGYEIAVGCASGAKGEMYFGAGQAGTMSRGFFVGAATGNNQTSPLDTEGLFVMTGGTFRVNGDNSNSWSDDKPNGVLIGYGARTSVRAGRPFIGTFRLGAGTFTQNAGGIVVGAGYGKGDYVQTGGTYEYKGTMPIDIGLCGGLGRVVVSNGTFKAKKYTAPYADLYVGGAPLSAVQPSGANFVAAGYPDFRHDADGKLTVAGGAVSTQGNTYVGADGDGVLEMVGSSGSFTTGTLVLSNAVAGAGTETARQTSSTVRFVLDADGVSPVKATNLVIAPGAKLEVDWRAYQGAKSRVRIFDVNPDKITGAFAPEDVSSVGVASTALRLFVRSDGLYAGPVRGLVVNLR